MFNQLIKIGLQRNQHKAANLPTLSEFELPWDSSYSRFEESMCAVFLEHILSDGCLFICNNEGVANHDKGL